MSTAHRQSHLPLISAALLPTYISAQGLLVTSFHRLRQSERGEGVISAAIAVLVMAFLGAAMWLAFKGMFQSTTEKTNRQVDQIGS